MDEGATATNTGTYGDVGVDTVTLIASIGTITEDGVGIWNWSWDTTDGPADSQTVTITATDSDGSATQTTFELTVANVAPTIDSIVVDPVAINSGDTVTVTGTFTDPALGMSTEMYTGTAVWSDGVSTPLTVNPDGTFSTTRQLDDGGEYTVEVTIDDGEGGSHSATSPVVEVMSFGEAEDDIASTAEDVAVVIHVLNNDPNADGNVLLITNVSDPAHGSLVINADGTITYTPDTDFHGTDHFTYETTDSQGATAMATVTVHVLSPTQQTQALADRVQDLIDDGKLKASLGRTLMGDLSRSESLLHRGRVVPALVHMGVFSIKVRLYVAFGILTSEDGDALLAAVGDLWTSLSTRN